MNNEVLSLLAGKKTITFRGKRELNPAKESKQRNIIKNKEKLNLN